MQSKQTKVKLKGRENQVRQNREIHLQSARLPSLHSVQWERLLAPHCQGLLLTAGLSSNAQWGSTLEQGPCAPAQGHIMASALRLRPWPAHLQARQLQKPEPFGSGPFPQQAWSQSMQTLERGRGGLRAAPLHEQHLGTVCTLHLSLHAPPTQLHSPGPHTAFIPPFPTSTPPKPALSPYLGNLSPSHHHPIVSQLGSSHFLPPGFPSSTPAPTI